MKVAQDSYSPCSSEVHIHTVGLFVYCVRKYKCKYDGTYFSTRSCPSSTCLIVFSSLIFSSWKNKDDRYMYTAFRKTAIRKGYTLVLEKNIFYSHLSFIRKELVHGMEQMRWVHGDLSDILQFLSHMMT